MLHSLKGWASCGTVAKATYIVTVSKCDGSVHFVSDSVDLIGVWRPMTTSRGMEVFPENDL